MGEIGIHAEAIGHLAELVPFLVDQHPFGLGIGLDLMTDHAQPLRGIEHQQIGLGALDLAARGLETGAQLLPGLGMIRAEKGMRTAGDDVTTHDRIHRTASFFAASVPARFHSTTALPVPITVP
jgi:hypothetical protein